MLSNTGGGSQKQHLTPNSAGSKRPRGVLIDGKWYCDCEPRVPAQHFQTKNGGRNHGRWFYTCRKPQGRRCGLFLWDDDARRRAGVGAGAGRPDSANTASAAYKNAGNDTQIARIGDDLTASDLEVVAMAMDEGIMGGGGDSKSHKSDVQPQVEPRTPTANRVRDGPFQYGLLTPVSELKRNNNNDTGNGSIRKRSWDDLDEIPAGGGYETPSKRGKAMTPAATGTRTVSAIKNSLLNGGKNNNTYNNHRDNPVYPQTPPRRPETKAGSPFSTRPIDSQLLSSQPSYTPYSSSQSQPQFQSQSQFRGTPFSTDNIPSTPTPSRFLPASPSQHGTSPQQPSSLTSQALSLLSSHKTPLQPGARKDLTKLLDTHELRLKGISKGRDISRVAIRKKDEQIQTLLERIDVLEAEREMWRASALRIADDESDSQDDDDDRERPRRFGPVTSPFAHLYDS